MVGGEEWGGVTGEGEENFVEHCGPGLCSVNTQFKNMLVYVLGGRSLWCPELVEEVLS